MDEGDEPRPLRPRLILEKRAALFKNAARSELKKRSGKGVDRNGAMRSP
jgi:hypothetical protein